MDSTRRGIEIVWGAPRLLVVGDVQGNADALCHLLRRARLIDHEGVEAPAWTGGASVLLLLGDLVDGGPQPAEVLSLVMSLSSQAREQGGRVLIVQGNHEQMLLSAFAASGEERWSRLEAWFSQGGLDTLARFARARGTAIPPEVIAATFVASFGDLTELVEPLQRLADFVERECAREIDFLARETVPAALVNGSVLGVHAGPDFGAVSLADFAASEKSCHALAWDRSWLQPWPDDVATLAARLAALKARLDDNSRRIDLRHIVFAHTQQEELRVPSFPGGTQYRVGRLVERDAERGVPGLLSVMTTPRALPRGGALGGLSFGPEGIIALYAPAAENDESPCLPDERLDDPDSAFPG